MTLGTSQILILAVAFLNIGLGIAKHGEKRLDSTYSFWSILFSQIFFLWVLYSGGFFT